MTVSPGDPIVFELGAIDNTNVATLDDDTAIVIYDMDGNGALRAMVLKADGSRGPVFEVEAAGGATGPTLGRVVGLSATKAMVAWRDNAGNILTQILNISTLTITAPGGQVTISTGASSSNLGLVAMSSTSAIATIGLDGGTANSRGVYLTVSGNTITLESAVEYDIASAAFTGHSVLLTSTKALTFHRQITGNAKVAVILSITGVTISAGALTTVEVNSGAANGAIPISATQALVCWDDNVSANTEIMVLDVSGTTITTNGTFTLDTASSNVALASFDSTTFVTNMDDNDLSNGVTHQGNIDGTSIITEGRVEYTSNQVSGEDVTALTSTLAIITYRDLGDGDKGKYLLVVRSEILLAPMTKPADINADGDQIYIAALNADGAPILIKIASALNANGELVFDPAAGDNIGVQCGRFDADVVWVAGAFDGTNVVEKSEDAGSTFTVKDTGAFGDVEAFVVGPDSDKRVLISDVTNDDIQETTDDGSNWTQINASVGFDINAIARLDKNVQETVFGNDAGANDNIDYSVNSGDDMEDYTTGDFPTASDVTSVIVN